MTTFESTQVQAWIGRDAIDVNGDKIGRIDNIYEDDETGGPEWFAIATGWFGTRVSFAPISGATPDGDRVRLRWEKSLVKDAPHAEEDGHLSPEEEARLYEHYGMDWATDDVGTLDAGITAGRDSTRSGIARDDAMTRSEEEIDVSTRERETGRARLRKWVETEDVNVTVPVRREVARLVTEPVSDRNIDRALDGPEITESEHEVVLHEEEVVVDKQVVPKERVRLETDTVEEEQVVSDEVRKERIAMEDDATRRR